MELKVMVASTLRRFKLRPAVHRDEIHEIGELVLRSKDGLPLYIMPRNVDDWELKKSREFGIFAYKFFEWS